MPRIPYNPTKQVARAQRQPRVNASGAMQQLQADKQAGAAVARVGNQVADVAADVYAEKRERETLADQTAFQVELAKQQSRLSRDLEALPVADGVDVETKAREIKEKRLGELREWLNQPGNVRHKSAQRVFERKLNEVEGMADIRLEEFQADYESRRSISRGERMVEQGILSGDESMVKQGIFIQRDNGKFDEKQAESVTDQSIEAMHQEQNRLRMQAFENAKVNGDWEAAKEAVKSMQGREWTEKKKDTFLKTERATMAYNQANVAISEAEGMGMDALEAIEGELAEDKQIVGRHRPMLEMRVKAAKARVQRGQLSNLRGFVKDAERGELDWGEFERAAGLSNAAGLPEGAAENIRMIQESAIAEQERESRFERDEDNPAFTTLMDELTALRFSTDGEKLQGEEVDKGRREEYAKYAAQIESLPVGAKAKAKLLDEWLKVRTTDLVVPGEEDTNWVWGLGGREFTEQEKRVRGEVIDTYREYLASSGTVPEGFADMVEADDMRLTEFFRNNENPTESELKAIREEITAPAMAEMLRKRARGEMPARQSAPVEIMSKEDFDALPDGARFIYNGREGVK